jgi:hypothetical protein
LFYIAARGPSGISSWFSWTSPTPEQQINRAIQDELFLILSTNPVIIFYFKKIKKIL